MSPEDDELMGELMVTQSGEERIVFVPKFELADCLTIHLREMRKYRAKNGKYLVVYEEKVE